VELHHTLCHTYLIVHNIQPILLFLTYGINWLKQQIFFLFTNYKI